VTLDSIDAKLLSQYNDYLLSVKRNNNNTVASQIKRLKRFLNAAEKQSLHNNQKYKDYTERETTCKNKFLNPDEVRALMEVKLTSESEQRVRDIMVVGCYTGMRYDDIKNFKKADIKEHRFTGMPEAYKATHIRQGKTSEELIVPLTEVVLNIIEKYKDEPTEHALPHLSLKTFNEVIKNVAKKAKLNTLQKIDTFRGATLETKYVERWRIVSSHYCRHTFITFCASKGMGINLVASITGQHPSTIIKHYLGVLGPEKFKAMSEKLKY
jgi:integrase